MGSCGHSLLGETCGLSDLGGTDSVGAGLTGETLGGITQALGHGDLDQHWLDRDPPGEQLPGVFIPLQRTAVIASLLNRRRLDPVQLSAQG